jgi:hypothetical protein
MAMTSTSPRMDVVLFPLGSFPGMLPLEGASDVMIFFIMVQSLSLCLTGVWVMWICCFKVFFEVDFGRSVSLLEIMFGSHYKLLPRVVGFLPTTAIANHRSEATWSAFLPFLALSTLSGAFHGGLNGRGPATISGRFHVI